MDQEQFSLNWEKARRAFISAALFFVALASVIALVEWAAGSLRLARLGQDMVPVAPATAICFLLLCGVLLARRLRPAAGYLAALHWLLAGLVMAAGVLILAEFAIKTFTGLDLDLERLLVREMRHPEGFITGRMSPLTASLFMLLSISVFSSFLDGRRRGRLLFLVSQSTAATVFAMSCLLLVGYWYGEPLLYGGEVTPVALTTSLGFLLLGAVLLVETPWAWLWAWFSSMSVAARFTRLTVPVTIMLILLAGWAHSRFVFAGGTIDFSLIALVTAGAVAMLTVAAARKIQAIVTVAERSLRERKEFAEGLIESSAVWIWRTGADLRHTYTNSFVTSCLGYEPEDFIALDTMGLVHPDDRDLMRVMVREAASTKQGWSGKVLRWRHKDGSWRHIETSGSPLFDAGGAFAGLQGVDRDVTERIQAEEALRESESKFRALFDMSTDGIFILDMEGNFIDVNRTAHERLGYTKEEMLAISVSKLDPPEFAARVPERLAQIREHGQAIFESAHTRKDGTVMPVEVNSRVIDYHGEKALFSVIRDITERKRAEEALRQSEERYRSIFNDSPIAIWDEDFSRGKERLDELRRDGVVDLRAYLDEHPGEVADLVSRLRVIDVNDASVSAFRARGKEELISGMPGYFTEASLAAFKEIVIALFEGRTSFSIEGPLLDAAGEPVVFDLSLSVPPGSRDTLSHVLVSLVDITERKRAEEALRESESKFRRLFDLLSDGIFILDMEGRFMDVNRTAHERLGYAKEEMLALKVSDIVPPEIGARTPERIRQIRENGQAIFESAHIRKDGDAMPVEVNARLIDYYGEPAMFSVIRDISERKQAESEQERLREQLARAQRMESVGRLAGGVAHDFNNMLGVIMGHVEIAKARFGPSDPTFQDLEEVHKAAQRSADLTRQLLAFARRQATSPRVIRLGETVGSMLAMLRRMIGEDIELRVEAAPDLWLVRVDPSQVDQIMANLLVNARDAIEGAGTVSISLDNVEVDEADAAGKPGLETGEYVRISVSDNGRGIDRETIDHVFEPFFTTKGMAEGTGLGLSTVYGIVKQNDGYINVESTLGEGTTFEIFLPRFAGAPEEGGARATAEAVSGAGETVMLVEDEPTVLRMTETMLRRLGYEVIATPGPSEAIRLARENSDVIDVLVTDVVMPEMSGRQLADQVSGMIPGVGCLFMSGYTADVISDHGVIDNDVSFLQKPFTAQQLAVKLRDVLRRKGQAGRA